MSKLKISDIARKNIQKKPARSFCLISVIFLFTLFLFAGSLISVSLSNGVEALSNRLGADVIVVPEGYDPHMDNILLSGKPSSFYLPEKTLDYLKDFENIAQMSPQIFLASLSASCCSVPVQLMGIDYDSDFIVKSWLKNSERKLENLEVIIGAKITGDVGDEITFFRQKLKITGKLEKTGMGFDAAIFMNKATAMLLMKNRAMILEEDFQGKNNIFSTVMLKLKNGVDSLKIAGEINRALNSKGIYALSSKKFVNNISDTLELISKIVFSSLFIIWFLAIIIIALIFSLSLSERKKEFGILRTIGASRSKLVKICLSEIFMISCYGSGSGILFGILLITVGTPFVTAKFNLPFMLPSFEVLTFFVIFSCVAAILTGIIASLFSVVKASRVDIHEIMRLY